MLPFYPKIRIHLWGGLGSQLFGLALMLDLKERFPQRNFCLVFHSGGVTKREPDLITLIDDCEFKVVDDFMDSSLKSYFARKASLFLQLFKWAYRFPVRKIGLIANANTSKEFNQIKPWVLSIRGHYSTRELSPRTIIYLADRIEKVAEEKSIKSFSPESIGVHYRIGDLVNLANKKPIESQRLASGLKRVILAHTGDFSIVICSDSPDLALNELTRHLPNVDSSTLNLNPMSTIQCLSEMRYFIGSPSKISEWVAMIRVMRKQEGQTLLPSEMKTQLTTTLGRTLAIQYF